jgi:hypothetical protein
MTPQVLHSEIPYILGKFDFLFYQRGRENSLEIMKESLHFNAADSHVGFYDLIIPCSKYIPAPNWQGDFPLLYSPSPVTNKKCVQLKSQSRPTKRGGEMVVEYRPRTSRQLLVS